MVEEMYNEETKNEEQNGMDEKTCKNDPRHQPRGKSVHRSASYRMPTGNLIATSLSVQNWGQQINDQALVNSQLSNEALALLNVSFSKEDVTKLFVRPLKDIISDNMEEDTDDESHEEDEDEYVSKCLGAISVSQLKMLSTAVYISSFYAPEIRSPTFGPANLTRLAPRCPSYAYTPCTQSTPKQPPTYTAVPLSIQINFLMSKCVLGPHYHVCWALIVIGVRNHILMAGNKQSSQHHINHTSTENLSKIAVPILDMHLEHIPDFGTRACWAGQHDNSANDRVLVDSEGFRRLQGRIVGLVHGSNLSGQGLARCFPKKQGLARRKP
ncbi:hypothetical protein Sjap_013051 [Stephania japonica]|uniref:Uncharacterized protein n=1 Tax=Stephania japonica TaxID=461633 RepID=A0AAP0IXA7_9MAGN